ncbi:undecaprenyl-diphosphatase [Marmoricola sp. OAE513]|uniref:undecaprenyl-diphosphate phosphatase n=1 Tax=Marmoricola sp. OAE513 TaxID=2817894 RepID=UPI001AE9AAE0
MDYLDAIILGTVEGLTEFLPVSSTGHLTIAEKILGHQIDAPEITAFTAVIQTGAIAAVLVYFRHDIWRIAKAWTAGVFRPEYRGSRDHRMGWYIIVGSLPIGVVGFAARDLISGDLRSLWVVGIALIVWSGAMLLAEKRGSQSRGEDGLTLRDAVVMGLVQCLALIPGVSRSGASISAGLFQGLDRVAATKMSFYLGIPSLVGAGIYELKDAGGIDAGVVVVGTLVSFLVAYASVAWLLKFVSGNSIGKFVPYRVVLGAVILVLLATGAMNAT